MSPTYRLILEPSLELWDVVIFFDKSGNDSLNCARSFSETFSLSIFSFLVYCSCHVGISVTFLHSVSTQKLFFLFSSIDNLLKRSFSSFQLEDIFLRKRFFGLIILVDIVVQ